VFSEISDMAVSISVLFRIYSRDSSVGIETDYELEGRGTIPGRGKGLLSAATYH
jgi:hypothetical protein